VRSMTLRLRSLQYHEIRGLVQTVSASDIVMLWRGRITDQRTEEDIASPLSAFFSAVQTRCFSVSAMPHIGKLLWDLGCDSSVCNIVRATPQCRGNLMTLSQHHGTWRQLFTGRMRTELLSFRGQRQLALVLDCYRLPGDPVHLDLHESFWPFVDYLVQNCMRAFPEKPELRRWATRRGPSHDDSNEAETAEYQINGNIYPFRPRQRPRGYYGHLQQEKASACRHGFPSHRKRTGGIMSSFCPHQV
jgi:hypothetical protein